MSLNIVAFVDGRYVPVARNWLAAVQRLGLLPLVRVVTLDAAAHAQLADVGVTLLHRPLASADLKDLWVHRVHVLAEFLAAGVSFIHSDVDAVWLDNPIPALTAGGSDLVFTQGTIWPPDVHRKRGFVLCCGLYFVRCSQTAIDFFGAFAQRVAKDKDDQMALNRLADETFKDWRIEEPYHLPFRETNFVCSPKPMTATSGGLEISVLPHQSFPRLMDGSGGVVVGHPLSGKTCEETVQALRQNGLWLLA